MSFFGKKTKDEPTIVTGIVGTGGKIDEMTLALVDAINDQEPKVRQSIVKSLQEIGKRQPDLVLSTCNDYISKNSSKISKEHRILLLNVVYQILELQRAEVSQGVMLALITLGINEMTSEKQEVVPEWQAAASSVLVSVGMRFPFEILEELMKRFTPGTVPHYFIMKTLGDLIFANALETVPKLKEVIARVLPVLASIKQDNMKWVFATGLGKFCDAILTYVANTKNSQFTVYSFSSDIYPAYEILFTTWLQSREPKVRLATIQALGSMCAVLEKDQLDAQLPRLVPTLLAFYKKEKELLPITQGFTNILEVAMKGGNRALDPLLPQIFATIHPLACIIPDYTNSYAIKNYNELLRCFQTITVVFSDAVITYLLERINNKDIKIKIGTIAIIRHLVTHNVEHLDDKKGLLVSGIKPLCATETSYTVRKELAQIIIAMSSHGYLQTEGGESLIEFIIRNCSITDAEISKYEKEKNKDPTATTPSELRNLCDNILNLATTTIEAVHSVLWPYLLETVINSNYNTAMGILCKCIAHIAGLKREHEAEDYIIDFDRASNVPKPQVLIARFLVMVNYPQRRNQLGQNILQTLKNIGPVLHPSICDMWDNAIPKLLSYLEANSNNWNQSVWEELILRLLSETIKIANDDEWTNILGDSIAKQFDLYNDDPEMKRIAFKHLGLVLQKSNHKESIKNKLEYMLFTVNNNNDAERLGCAQGFGYCATTHLDMTLEKVQSGGKGGSTNPQPKKSGGLLSFLSKDKTESVGDITTTLILCYGYIAAYAQPSLITSRIDISIINHLKPTMVKAKSNVVKECMITTIDLIGKAMHSSHLKKEYIFKQRDDLLRQLLVYMTQTGSDITNQIRILGLNACATLINLDPVLSEELETSLLEKIVPFFALPGIDPNVMQQIMDNLFVVFGNILLSEPTLDCLCRLFKFIEPYVCSKEAGQREKAINSVLFLLKKTVELKSKDTSDKREKFFNYVGHCIAMLVPRCTDPVVAVRQAAIEGIQLCLFIDYILRHSPGQESAIPQELVPFKAFKDRIVVDELNEQFSIIHEMSRVLSVVITKEELPELLLSSLKGLNDSQLSSTSGTCVVLNGLIKARGSELLPKVSQIVGGLLTALEGITQDQTMNGTLHALRSLATHHEIPVVDELLKAPVPHTTFVCKALQAIAKDENLVMNLIQHLFEIINNSQLYEEKPSPDPKTKKPLYLACHVPMSATCALGELLQLEELEDVVTENYPLFFGSLVLRIGTAYGMQDKAASEQITTTFRQFVACAKETVVEAVMAKKNSWELFTSPDYHRAITDISGAVCKAHPTEMEGIYNFLFPFLKGNFIGQRIVAATVLAEFINHCQNNRPLLSKLVTCILSSLRDPTIKLQSLIGLGNIVAVGTEEANQYAPTVLDALMSSIDDTNEVIALEAMNGLSKVFKIVEESRISPILVNICHRIKPAFDKEHNDVRKAAFTLFGALHRFGNGSAADAFYEQIHDNLPSVVIHLNDENSGVQAACKSALKDFAPLFKSKELEELFTSSSLDPNRNLDYIEFLNDLSIRLINSFPQRINYYVMTSVEYFKSNWNICKANAVNFVGFLLGNMPAEKRKGTNINPGLITKSIILLLKERSPEVRKACADSMSLLHTY